MGELSIIPRNEEEFLLPSLDVARISPEQDSLWSRLKCQEKWVKQKPGSSDTISDYYLILRQCKRQSQSWPPTQSYSQPPHLSLCFTHFSRPSKSTSHLFIPRPFSQTHLAIPFSLLLRRAKAPHGRRRRQEGRLLPQGQFQGRKRRHPLSRRQWSDGRDPDSLQGLMGSIYTSMGIQQMGVYQQQGFKDGRNVI
ncbi:uncharacterized protein LOC130761603 [Actinidia eriantha]|uniref:uncharacterized protein LOC130761603 n=1 Tax=Actinidia eriantha TaxID=165200 RepID=UPI0025828728|nr:uncharacterized protein LOC130761603 [Actinidia eriantha]